MAAEQRSIEEVAAVLEGHHDAPVHDLVALRGGYWSAAYAYRSAGHDLVARFGADREGYDLDRAAMAYTRPGLPVPDVVDIVPVEGGWLAISVRHHGAFLEELTVDEARRAAPAIDELFTALRGTRGSPDMPSWRDWLASGLVDDPSHPVSGWSTALAADRRAAALHEAASRVVRTSLPRIPERRDLVHGDLLHQNVLVDDDRVSAVFSWKCSTFGDFLYDAAWCHFWSPWHPGIASLDIVGRALAAPDLSPDDLAAADVRLLCYLAHIGATHLSWTSWTGDERDRTDVADRTEAVLAQFT